jgi:hypothetical protein
LIMYNYLLYEMKHISWSSISSSIGILVTESTADAVHGKRAYHEFKRGDHGE